MRDIQGLSYQEIEQTLNLSQSQVKVYLHRARRQLRENSMLRQLAADQNLLADVEETAAAEASVGEQRSAKARQERSAKARKEPSDKAIKEPSAKIGESVISQ